MLVVRPKSDTSRKQNGFSLVELLIVVAIIAVVSAMAIPAALNMMHLYRLRNAGSEFAGLVQQARSRAVRDSTFYPVYLTTDGSSLIKAFVGIKGSTIDTVNDPVAAWSADVTIQDAGSAPSTTALKNSFIPGVASSVTYVDGKTTTTPITFSSMGTPCVKSGSACNATTTNSALGTPVAYWIFFQNSRSQQWEAVTVTPAGKIQRWSLSGTSWTLL